MEIIVPYVRLYKVCDMSMMGIFKDAAKKAGSFCWDHIRGVRLTLLEALERGDWAKAGRMLQQNPDASDWDLQGMTPIVRKPLHAAASSGDFTTLSILLRPEFFKGDIDIRDSQGATPLLLAATAGDDMSLRALIAKGADVNAVDKLGRSVLGCAAQFNRVACMQVLLKHGALVDGPEGSRTPLGEAARAGYCRPAVTHLLAAGANPDHIGQLKQSALEVCLQEHNIEAAIELLKAGANPNNRTPETGAKLLYWAMSINHDETVKMLLDGGTDPLLPAGEGRVNALQFAAHPDGKVNDNIKKMVAARAGEIDWERNMAGVEKGMAAGTAAPITVKPIKLRVH